MALAALTPDEMKGLILSVGTHRAGRPLSPVEVATLFQKTLRAGTTLAECAEAVQLDSTSQVSRFTAVLSLPLDVQHLVDWGRSDQTVAFTSAFEISRLSGPDDQRAAVRAILENGLSTSEIRQLVQSRKRSGQPIGQCIESVLKMRPQVDVRHVFLGAVADEALQAKLRAMPQEARDRVFGVVLAALSYGARGRLGADRFTLVGDSKFGEVLKTMKTRVESEVNDGLRGAL